MNEEQRLIKGKIYYHFIAGVLKKIEGVDYAVIKGEPLSILEYGRCGCRDYSDIDILIERKNIRALLRSLRTAGFQPVDASRYKRIFYDLYSHQTIPYCKKIGGFPIYVDINYDLFWGEYQGRRIDVQEFLSDSAEQEIYGYKVNVLPAAKAFVQLVLHSYKEMNSLFLLDINHGYTYKTFQDMYLLLKSNRTELSAEQIWYMCAEYRIFPYAYYVLYYTAAFYGEEWLDEYVAILKNGPGEQLLECFGLNERERKRWQMGFRDRFEIEDFRELIKDRYSEWELEKIEINRKVQEYEN